MTGRWNTMARRRPSVAPDSPPTMGPVVGGISPMARRISEVFPEPLGPISTVGAPGASTSEMRSRMMTPPLRTETPSAVMGSSLGGARMTSSGMEFADSPRKGGGGVDHDDEGDQHDAEADGEREIALGGLKRDCGRHGTGETVDIAAHDH